MNLKTVCFIETDEDGNIEWYEGCVSSTAEVYGYSKELVDKTEAVKVIKDLQRKVSELGWQISPDRMGG